MIRDLEKLIDCHEIDIDAFTGLANERVWEDGTGWDRKFKVASTNAQIGGQKIRVYQVFLCKGGFLLTNDYFEMAGRDGRDVWDGSPLSLFLGVKRGVQIRDLTSIPTTTTTTTTTFASFFLLLFLFRSQLDIDRLICPAPLLYLFFTSFSVLVMVMVIVMV